MKNFFFMPPLGKSSGGMAVIAQLAVQLAQAGFEVAFVANGAFPANLESCGIPVLQLGDAGVSQGDRWIVPEGWPSALNPGLLAKAQCAVYAQNWAFLHGLLPEDLEWTRLPVRMLAVSQPVALFIQETCGLDAPVISPAINSRLFFPPEDASYRAKRRRIAWMPRKNKGLAKQVMRIFEAMLKTSGQPLPEWVTIENASPSQVADLLRSSQLFLATGFPEGFALPPLEAMACGCLVAGFGGMGGWAYMRQAMHNGFKPLFELPPRPWGPNGFYAADGDVWGAAMALKAAWDLLDNAGEELEQIIKSGLECARFFSPARQKEELLSIWQNDSFWDGK